MKLVLLAPTLFSLLLATRTVASSSATTDAEKNLRAVGLVRPPTDLIQNRAKMVGNNDEMEIAKSQEEETQANHHRDLLEAEVIVYQLDDNRVPPVTFTGNPLMGATGYYGCGIKITSDSFYIASMEFIMCSAGDWNDQRVPLVYGNPGQFSQPQEMCPETTYITGMQVTTRSLENKSDNGFLPQLVSHITARCRPTDGSSFQKDITLYSRVYPFPQTDLNGSNNEYTWTGVEHSMKTLPVDIDGGRRFMRGFQAVSVNGGSGNPAGIGALKLIGDFMPSYSSAPILGTWESVIQGGQAVSYELQVKYSKTDSTTISETDSQTFTLGVTAGFEFGTKNFGVSGSVTVENQWTSSVTQAVATTFSSSVGEIFTASCVRESPTGSWSLWRWRVDQVQNSDGPGFQAQTKVFKCTSTAAPPRCPYGFCADNDPECQTCKEPFADLSAAAEDPTCRGGLFKFRCK